MSCSSWSSDRLDSLHTLPSSKHGVVVARVLVVDQPESVGREDEVLGQQIVVARHGRLFARAEGVADSRDVRRELEVALGQAEATGLDDLQVARLGLEHVEVVAEARAPRAGGGRPPRSRPDGRRRAASPRSSSWPSMNPTTMVLCSGR